MKISSVRRILKEDILKSGEAPAWIDQLLGPLNEFIDVVTQALRNGITFSDNLNAKIVYVKLSHGVEQDVSPIGLKDRVIGIIPLSAGDEILDKYGFQLKSSGQVGITYYFANTSASLVSCRILLITG